MMDESTQAEIAALWVNMRELHGRVRMMEKYFDTADSPWWKRLLFRLDGWGPWFQLRTQPRWRPWRRWWTS